MSAYGDILDEILGNSALSEYETAREFVPPPQIPRFPFAYAFMRGMSAERIRHYNEERTFDVQLVIFVRGETQEEFYTRIDSIVDGFYGLPNRLLNLTVDSFHISQIVPFELSKPDNLKGAAITFTAVKAV